MRWERRPSAAARTLSTAALLWTAGRKRPALLTTQMLASFTYRLTGCRMRLIPYSSRKHVNQPNDTEMIPTCDLQGPEPMMSARLSSGAVLRVTDEAHNLALDIGDALRSQASYLVHADRSREGRGTLAVLIVERLRAQGWEFTRKGLSPSGARVAITSEELNASNDV